MDNSNNQQNFRQADHLGVNKLGKNIKKSPLHQPTFTSPSRQQPQPQVYNINKNDFRNIVQQLTGSPARETVPRPHQNQPKPPNNRLQRVRPPPLAPTNRPPIQVHPHLPVQIPARAQPLAQPPYANNYVRALPLPHPAQFDRQPSPTGWFHPTPTDVWINTTESPISAYMRYLQNSIIDDPRKPQSQPQPYLHPGAAVPLLPSPRINGAPQLLASPRLNGPPPPLASPRIGGPPPTLPSPRMHGPPPPLPSPNSQFIMPSPTGFWNLLSPRSPYPLLSPGYQHLPPFSPGFSFSSATQSGILGPGPPLPPSPGYGFPLSPSGFFPLPSPSWRD